MSGIDADHLNYVPFVAVFNGSDPAANGGDSATEDLNIWYEVRIIGLCV